jgi:hypothetical protein|tara:strand:+ start:1432 stop:1689 length:258 start_codon:yes stop_codon:yes gene_type:complete
MDTMRKLYSLDDWAKLFSICVVAFETENKEPVRQWMYEFAMTHDLPQPIDNSRWSDVDSTIKEVVGFLENFAENYIDNLSNISRR